MGRAEQNLKHALDRILALDGVTPAGLSKIYRTEPQGPGKQPWYANQAVALDLKPGWTTKKLLESLFDIEQNMGRVRQERFGPRIIDLDILLFDDLVLDEPGLVIPHPRMKDRAFVLVPLMEIAPDLVLPDGDSLAHVAAGLDYQLRGDRIYQPGRA